MHAKPPQTCTCTTTPSLITTPAQHSVKARLPGSEPITITALCTSSAPPAAASWARPKLDAQPRHSPASKERECADTHTHTFRCFTRKLLSQTQRRASGCAQRLRASARSTCGPTCAEMMVWCKSHAWRNSSPPTVHVLSKQSIPSSRPSQPWPRQKPTSYHVAVDAPASHRGMPVLRARFVRNDRRPNDHEDFHNDVRATCQRQASP